MFLRCGGVQLQDIFFTLKGDLSKYDDAAKALTQQWATPGKRTTCGTQSVFPWHAKRFDALVMD